MSNVHEVVGLMLISAAVGFPLSCSVICLLPQRLLFKWWVSLVWFPPYAATYVALTVWLH